MHPRLVIFWLLPVLVIAATIAGHYRYPKFKKRIQDGHREVLIRMYISTIIFEIVGGSMAWLSLGRSVFSPPESQTDSAVPIGILCGALVAGIVGGLLLRRKVKKKLKTSSNVLVLLPRSSTERYWFAAVSFGAGTGEELMFRGFGFRFFDHVGVSGQALIVVTAIVFGLAHSYQGWGGMIMTSIIGLVLGIFFVSSGSLWLPIVVHILFDLRIVFISPKVFEKLEKSQEAAIT
jgi:membrane protease YdiL (CAAX protease family)